MINRGKILEAIYTEKLESVQVERAVRTKLADLDPHYSDTREGLAEFVKVTKDKRNTHTRHHNSCSGRKILAKNGASAGVTAKSQVSKEHNTKSNLPQNCNIETRACK